MEKIKLTKKRIKELNGIKSSLSQTTFISLIAEGYVELIDIEEEEYNCMISMYPELIDKKKNHTHCDIHPVALMGEATAAIPYSNHNHLPRDSFQAAHGKQAISVPSLAFKHKMDTLSYILHYPQKPLSFTN